MLSVNLNGLRLLGLTVSLVALAQGRYSTQCNEKSIEKREEDANIVVSGLVDRIMREPKQMTYTCEVKVIRFFKGENQVGNNMNQDNMIMVKGFGNPSLCDNTVHKGDVRILMLNQDVQGQYSLNSSLVRITIGNLDHAEAAVSDIPFVTRQPVTQGPCMRVLCGFGASCQLNEKQEPICVCPDVCPSVYTPVCGSDGISYYSECMLQKNACIERKIITKVSDGACLEEFGNPCDERNCEFGAECMLSQDGMSAKCVCPQECDLSDYSLVCGSDGNTYQNECELNRYSCMQRKNINIVYHGECNPCKEFECNSGVCGLDEDRMPYCPCEIECDKMPQDKICANDWKIYNSTCEIERAACRSSFDLFPLNNGECFNVENPCSNWVCQYSSCIVDSTGEPTCACPVCMDIYEPVCSTDGNTYHSKCHFERERCLNAIEMVIVTEGECVTDEASLCKGHVCDFGGYCVVEDGKPVCKCDMMCPDVVQQVCGSDGMSYSSQCALIQAGCEQKVNINIAYEGLCEGCEDHECPFGGICEMRINGPECVCPDGCVDVEAPVCGSDEVTYSNECKLRVQACKTESDIQVASQGLCDECERVTCEFGAFCDRGLCQCPSVCPLDFEPVCGDDGKTYDNDCFLKLAMCETKKFIIKEFSGRCQDGSGSGFEGSGLGSGSGDDEGSGKMCDETNCIYGTCEWKDDEFGSCNCRLRCPAERSSVCGSDGKTYASECFMKETACRSRRYITVTKYSSCEEDFGACDGDIPLKKPGTNQDMYCGQEPGSDICPEKSYCHTNTERTFAKCCPDEKTHGCAESMYGCCPDRKTSARGRNFAGCPSLCKCNELGSYRRTCDPETLQCSCKPGVGGTRCDRCEPGFWDFRGIQNGNSGCRPCSCQPGGSVRDDCDQMNGQCMCKPSVMGMKCDICPFNEVMTSSGCELLGPGEVVESCDQLECRYGCIENRGVATCLCPQSCPEVGPVCGSDGTTYASECMLDLVACRSHRDIRLVSREKCKKPLPCSPTNCEAPCLHGYKYDENGCQTCICIAGPTTADPAVASTVLENISTKSEVVTMEPETETIEPEVFSTTPMQTQPGKLLTADMSTLEPDAMRTTIIEGVTYRTELVTEYEKIATEKPKMATDGTASKTGVDQFATATMIAMEKSTMYETVTIDIDQKQEGFMSPTPKGTKEAKVDFTPEPMVEATMVATEVVTERSDTGAGPTTLEMTDQQVTGESNVKQTKIAELGVTETMEKEVTEQIEVVVTEKIEVTEKVEVTTEKVLDVTKGIKRPLTTMPTDDEDDITEMGSGTGEEFEATTQILMTHVVGTVVPPMYTASGCEMTMYGCCDDGITPAEGPGGQQCPLTVTTPEPPPPACASMPCLNAGSCVNRIEEPGFFCLCPLGKNGPVCEEDNEYTTPSFFGHSYIAFEKRRRMAMSAEIEMEFYTESDSGLLFYQSSNDGSEFISLAVVDGFVEFRWQGQDAGSAMTTVAMPAEDVTNDFDTGLSDILVLRSTERIAEYEWHTVVALYERRDGSLQVDDQEKVKGRSPSGSSFLVLETDVFIGGVFDNPESLYQQFNVRSGLVGCVRKVAINDEPYNLEYVGGDALFGASIAECGVSPCDAKPCLNNATCVEEAESFQCQCVDGFFGPLCGDIFVDPCEGNMCRSGSTCVPLPEGGYRCDCPMGLQGEKCEEDVVEEVYIPAFSGVSYIERPGLKMADETSINITFLSKRDSGMILYNGQKGAPIKGDFISLNMVKGYLEFRYNLGGGEANIRSETPLSLNEFHDVYLTRNRRSGMMVIDNGNPITGQSKGTQSQLNLGSNLFIGGRRRDVQLATRSGITTDLTGAIEKFMVGGEMIDDLLEGAINVVEVTNYQDDVCRMSPCMDGFMCVKNGTTYACVCPSGKVVTDDGCESVIDPGMVSGPQPTTPSNKNIVGFDGSNTLKYPSGGKIRFRPSYGMLYPNNLMKAPGLPGKYTDTYKTSIRGDETEASLRVKAARTSQIKLDVRTVNRSGVIVWNGKNDGSNGDFLAIAIINGLPEFTYNLGSGTLRIKSTFPINDGNWHTLYAMRNLRDGSLQVDDETPIIDASKSGASQLDTDGILLLGGIQGPVPRNVPTEYTNRFEGCIKNVQIGGTNLRLVEDAIDSKPTQFCSEI